MADVIERFDGPKPEQKGIIRRARASWPFDVLDILGAIALGILAYGCSFIHPGLPYIVTGVVLLVWVFFAALPPRTGGV